MAVCESDQPPQGRPALPADRRLEAIWATVASIPEGRVSTYGEIARLAGLPGLARFAGFALSRLSADNTLPWHRVVNASGRISFPPDSGRFVEQSQRLRAEGIRVNSGKIESFRRLRWPTT